MTPQFSALIEYKLSLIKIFYEHPERPKPQKFEDFTSLKFTENIDKKKLILNKLISEEYIQEYIDFLKDETYFTDIYFKKPSLCALFWAFQITVIDHWAGFTRPEYHEESQNSGLFGCLSSVLGLLGALDNSITAEDGFFLYSADCRSDRTESELGTDFGIIIPVGDDQYKVALFQAKKTTNLEKVSISRESPKGSSCQQLTRMLKLDSQFNQPHNTGKIDGDKFYESLLFNRLCFYVFWHDPNTYFLPTILSAEQARQQIIYQKNIDYLNIETTNQGSGDKGMDINPMLGGTWFSDAIPLLLADPKSDFGIKMSKLEICKLLESKFRPRSIVGLQIPTENLSVGDWRDLIPENYVKNEKFSYKGELYQGREKLADVKPQAQSPAP